ncbi:hypothetical protein WJX81_005919 [Elliptochloris bilobata]|uniref:Uncharacterized protein n=1 Tax=Elliptochloris bilobata TaxID=381761 RepID=A0AAW1R3G4_9CHLO
MGGDRKRHSELLRSALSRSRQVRWRSTVAAATHRLRPVLEEPSESPAALEQGCDALGSPIVRAAAGVPGAGPILNPADGDPEAAALQLAVLGQELAAAQLEKEAIGREATAAKAALEAERQRVEQLEAELRAAKAQRAEQAKAAVEADGAAAPQPSGDVASLMCRLAVSEAHASKLEVALRAERVRGAASLADARGRSARRLAAERAGAAAAADGAAVVARTVARAVAAAAARAAREQAAVVYAEQVHELESRLAAAEALGRGFAAEACQAKLLERQLAQAHAELAAAMLVSHVIEVED